MLHNPKTGSNITLWTSLMLISMIGIAVTLKFLKKKK
ncbi:MAG: LPXTG cell wall anchor domain-containing protein [Clostridia bacterium]|nr:LPXTG cell wall anchor domain-containing protein [Clostridia bacterium]